MKMKTNKTHWTLKLGLLCSSSALCICLINIFLNSQILRAIIWTLAILSMTMNAFNAFIMQEKYFKMFQLKAFECMQLRYSYRSMAAYIKEFDVPGLGDLRMVLESLIDKPFNDYFSYRFEKLHNKSNVMCF